LLPSTRERLPLLDWLRCRPGRWTAFLCAQIGAAGIIACVILDRLLR